MSEGGEGASGRAYDVAEGVSVSGMMLVSSHDNYFSHRLFYDLPEGCTVTVARGVAIAVAVACGVTIAISVAGLVI